MELCVATGQRDRNRGGRHAQGKYPYSNNYNTIQPAVAATLIAVDLAKMADYDLPAALANLDTRVVSISDRGAGFGKTQMLSLAPRYAPWFSIAGALVLSVVFDRRLRMGRRSGWPREEIDLDKSEPEISDASRSESSLHVAACRLDGSDVLHTLRAGCIMRIFFSLLT